jgi:hypothetical protein
VKVGDLVKRADADETSLPAYRDMRGKVVEVSPDGSRCRIHWIGDREPDFWNRPSSDVEVV